MCACVRVCTHAIHTHICVMNTHIYHNIKYVCYPYIYVLLNVYYGYGPLYYRWLCIHLISPIVTFWRKVLLFLVSLFTFPMLSVCGNEHGSSLNTHFIELYLRSCIGLSTIILPSSMRKLNSKPGRFLFVCFHFDSGDVL